MKRNLKKLITQTAGPKSSVHEREKREEKQRYRIDLGKQTSV